MSNLHFPTSFFLLTYKVALNQLLLTGRYRGVHMAKTWMLEAVKGEHPDVELNMVSPDPAWPPELVVQAQLEALRLIPFEKVF